MPASVSSRSGFGRRPDTPAVVMAMTAVMFVAVAFTLTLRLRHEVRMQILGREAAALGSMVGLQQAKADDELARFGLGAEPEDWFPLLLETYRLRDVIALRLFDAGGRLRDAQPVPASAQIDAGDWRRLVAGEAFARFHPGVRLASLPAGGVEFADADGVPLLEILVPLRVPGGKGFAGVAQYWIDGAAMEKEFARLDRSLWLRSGLATLTGATIALAALAWAFRRLQAAYRDLQERSDDLARANREFSLAAKTSALGAITAHLIHGLKNPLAGLEGYVAGQPAEDAEAAGEERRAAIETTRRIRTLVNEVVAILREEQSGGAAYRLTIAELVAIAAEKIRPLATARQVTFACQLETAGELPGRRAHLALLVLDNLLRNACEASPAGGRVTLTVWCQGQEVVFFVDDEGTGLADAVRERLFEPVNSTKPGGGGIGLVISHHLALHAGGTLRLEKNDARGCRFRLAVPLEVEAPSAR